MTPAVWKNPRHAKPVCDRFTEGFDTADLKAAKALVDALAEPAALRTGVS
jgi:hypothetical protein